MFLFSFDFWLGVAAGGAACALSVTVYNWFKKQTASATAAVSNVSFSALEAKVKALESDVANVVSKVVSKL